MFLRFCRPCVLICHDIIGYVAALTGVLVLVCPFAVAGLGLQYWVRSYTSVSVCDYLTADWSRNVTCVFLDRGSLRTIQVPRGKSSTAVTMHVFTLRCPFSHEPVTAVPWWELIGDATFSSRTVNFSSSSNVTHVLHRIRPNAEFDKSSLSLPVWRQQISDILFAEEGDIEQAAKNPHIDCAGVARTTAGMEIAMIFFSVTFVALAPCCFGMLYCVDRRPWRIVRDRQVAPRGRPDDTEVGRDWPSDTSETRFACHACKSPNDDHHVACIACSTPQPDVLRQQTFTFNDDAERQLCSVCVELFQGAEKCVLLPCAHIYHVDCILAWLRQHDTCPVCKLRLVDMCKSDVALHVETKREKRPKNRKRRGRRRSHTAASETRATRRSQPPA
jgi:hypothetical protein